MKWFKHDTDCDRSEGLNLLLCKYGMSGYGRWFRILEIVAEKMDNTDLHSVSYPLQWWCEKLDFSPRQFWKFMKDCEKLCHISIRTSSELESRLNGSQSHLQSNSLSSRSEVVEVFIPNLLKKRDEYSEKSRQTPDKCRDKLHVRSKIEEVRDKNTEETSKPPLEEIPYKEIIDHLNGALKTHYRSTSASTREHIAARWKEGATLAEFKRAIDNMALKWGKDPKMCSYLRPDTLFAKGKFDGYVNQIITEKEKRGVML